MAQWWKKYAESREIKSFPFYQRNINIYATQENGNVLTRASFVDPGHNIQLELKVNLSNKEILEAKAEMIHVPYKICNKTLAEVSRIIGLRIEHGITQKLTDIIGGASGCAHLCELVISTVKCVAPLTIGSEFRAFDWKEVANLPEEEIIQLMKPFLKNTCLAFKE